MVLGGLIVATAAQGSGAHSHLQRRDHYTPVVQSVLSEPRWFRGADHRIHLAYELRLINGFPVPIRVTGLRIRDPRRHRTLARLKGARLRQSMSLLAEPSNPTRTLPSSSVGIVYVDLTFKRRAGIPETVKHALTVHVPPGLPVSRRITTVGASARVDQRPPIVLGPMLRGRGWIAVGSCCDGPHRRSIQPVNGHLRLGQRFAIDWNGFDRRRYFVRGDQDVNRNWTFFGKPVVAVREARVVKAFDRLPDQIPNHPTKVGIRKADGNYVILALGQHRFAFYAHLEAGSVRVRAGQHVREGQVIGRLGNSGSSTGPHLHFQVMNRPSALDSDGLPFVFDRFYLRGKTPSLDAMVPIIEAEKPVPVDRRTAGPRRNELPLGLDVVDFPARG